MCVIFFTVPTCLHGQVKPPWPHCPCHIQLCGETVSYLTIDKNLPHPPGGGQASFFSHFTDANNMALLPPDRGVTESMQRLAGC